MVSLKLYVEGGGDSSLLRTACRQGFSQFLKKAGLTGRMPRIVAGGSRQDTYKGFCTAITKGTPAILLVDSETPVAEKNQKAGDRGQWQPWRHLNEQVGDKWVKPENAKDKDCHLMVQCMESWIVADRKTLQWFFGQGFNQNALPPVEETIESIPKEVILHSLAESTKRCKTKARYGKGEHSFKILAILDPDKVQSASPWAKRFIEELMRSV